MKAKLSLVLECGNFRMSMLDIQCKSPDRAHEVMGLLISGSIAVPEVGKAHEDKYIFGRKEKDHA